MTNKSLAACEGGRNVGDSLTVYGAAVLTLCVLIGMTEGYDVQAMALAAPLVRAAWKLDFSQIGLLLSVSAIGLVLGSFLLSPLGDSIGRRKAILLGLFLAGLGTGTGAVAASVPSLTATRLLAGVGLGCALPNVLALAFEMVPFRMRTFAVVLVSCGYPFGSAVGSAFASLLLPQLGHTAIFVVGGSATAFAFVLSLFALPESPSVLARDRHRSAELQIILARLGRSIPPESLRAKVSAPSSFVDRIRALITPGRRQATILLWLMNFGNVALAYFYFTWLPSLIVNDGLTAETAIRATAVFSMSGAVGGLAMVWLLPRVGAIRLLTLAYAVSAAATTILMLYGATSTIFYPTLAVAGVCVVGSQFSLSAVVADFYPSAIRATASGFAAGIGRAGAILTPVAAGALISLLGSSSQSFTIALASAIVALFSGILLELRGEFQHDEFPEHA
jgi:MFS transporter, AAHS family, 4-hydroxybenzoate transporter